MLYWRASHGKGDLTLNDLSPFMLNRQLRLILQSSQIGLMCYMMNWYKLSPRIARDLILIIAISSHPIKISAGRMVDLSLTTFGNVRHIYSDSIFYSKFEIK